MTRDQIIEVLARAKCERDGYKPDEVYPATGKPFWRCYESEAARDVAALESAGLAVVPTEPTEEMISALQSYAVCAGYIEEGYTAMLAAFPAPPEATK